MRISVVPLDSPGDVFGLVCDCQSFDQPDRPALPLTAFQAAFDNPWPSMAIEHYVALADDKPAGYLVLRLPQRDNLSLAEIDLRVLPTSRRRGVGRALLERAVARARELGRDHLVGTSIQIRPDGGAFAAAVGASAALQQIRSRLDLSTVDQGRLDALLADAWTHAEGYELVQWVGVPPDRVIDGVGELVSRFFAEAPTGDLALEPERVGAAELRTNAEANEARGRDLFATAVVRDGRVAGWTEIAAVRAEPEHAWQQTTLVVPEHRGHRLGLVLKLENLRLIRRERPALRYIDTMNALENRPMMRINRAIGFAAAESTIEWQLVLS